MNKTKRTNCEKEGGEKENRMTICIGIDVHKKKCIATLKRDSQEIVEQTSFHNSSHGIREFIEHIKLCDEGAIAVCESTGNYWIRLHDTLEDNGIDTVLANPIKTKIIAQAKLKEQILFIRHLCQTKNTGS